MKRTPRQRDTLVFILVAVLLMIAAYFTFDGKGFTINPESLSGVKPAAGPAAGLDDDSPIEGEGFENLPYPEVVPNASGGEARTEAPLIYDHPLVAEFKIEEKEPAAPKIKSVPKPRHRYTMKNPNPNAPARIAIIIDDMGMNRPLSHKMAAVDFPLTLAYLPYAEGLSEMTAAARKHGHELMIHMPMEAMDKSQNTGPIAIKNQMSREDVQGMLGQAFGSFDGYVGLNNHMGSRVTQNSEIMGWVMDELGERGLFYVDSKTISSSVGADMARVEGIDYAVRDVFLDHEESDEFVRSALEKTEAVALQKGYAIAIGHPKDVTLRGLQEWLPTLKARGFEVVPVSELLMVPDIQQAKADVKQAPVDKIEELLAIEPAAGPYRPEDFEFNQGIYDLPN